MYSNEDYGSILLLLKARKPRSLLLAFGLAVVSLCLLWANSSEHPAVPAHAANTLRPAESTPPVVNATTTTAQPAEPSEATDGPKFRLIIPAAEASPDFCRTVLSGMLLDFPPPTILGYDERHPETMVASIQEHLEEESINDDDLVLIVDGYSVWFQLPSSVLIAQYEHLLERANAHLLEKYGAARPSTPYDAPRPLFTQSVIWGADERCWSSAEANATCASVAEPTARRGGKLEGDSTFERKYLTSGTVMGPARDLRAIFSAAKMQGPDSNGNRDMQTMFATLFGEQQQAREQIRRENLGTAGRWREWLVQQVRGPWISSSRLDHATNMTIVPGRQYEYSMGLDNNGSLFQTMTPPHTFSGNIRFLRYNESVLYNASDNFPSALDVHGSPFALSAGDAESAAIPNNEPNGLAIDPELDALPSSEQQWALLPLAHNLRTGSVPAALHFPAGMPMSSSNGADYGVDSIQYLDPREVLWPHLWFYPHARALLRRYMRQSTVGELEDEVNAHSRWWRASDVRGGRGGVWTDNAEWLAWGDICAGYESEVFGDGKGVWMQEMEERVSYEPWD
ncbi:uncharacterized protein K452DRAFT_301059 [Aplosporella prunicola CBS 121167]|uniref:Uncharacterized protein n=1 Tax=Aplosporella prunicola CBS 121167 TaxID=1176127 RepID=A0A6A6B5H0_9PEZI|nr:uncharacterized protein K452DRAFT_301059 [Aplosporella prunicola CBS 121167]KAF2138525.1 hypothetical protein K452DRAFT_301059 [Aplosporella prunicola CBS 121167]